MFGKSKNTDAAAVKSRDGIVSVQPAADGLLITKNHKAMFTRIDIHVRGENGENYSISTDDKHKQFLYPFVEAGKNYSVYLTMMDSNWGNWTKSQSAEVTATGGLGDARMTVRAYHYDNSTMSIVLDDYDYKTPENVLLSGKNFSGNVYYDQTPGKIDWKKCAWYSYTFKNGTVDISKASATIANTSFFIQLDSFFEYKENSYHLTLISNENNPFKDTHLLKNVEISSGILVPPFSPGCTQYTIRGTQKTVTIQPEFAASVETTRQIHLVNSENPEDVISYNSDGVTYSYKFTYQKPETFNFDGKEYLQTFYDDFNGTELNPENWQRCREEERQSSMNNHGWWNNSCSYLDGKGNLILEQKYQDGKKLSGAIDTEGIFEQSHGYYEIKFKCDNTSGLWYAFWLMGHNDGSHIGKGAVDAAEIDVWELVPKEPYNGPNYFKTTIHWDGYGPEHKAKGSPAHNPDDSFYEQWHVAQFVWGENSYKLWLDGELLYELDASRTDEEHFGGMCNGKNWIIISAEFGDWGGPFDEKQLPAKMYVDYVKAGLEK